MSDKYTELQRSYDYEQCQKQKPEYHNDDCVIEQTAKYFFKHIPTTERKRETKCASNTKRYRLATNASYLMMKINLRHLHITRNQNMMTKISIYTFSL